MRLPHLPDATRFFGRVLAALLECPRCGTVQGWGHNAMAAKAIHDQRTNVWECKTCHLQGQVGLLIWPLRRAHYTRGSGGKTRPRDQVPNERQLAQMRADVPGFWLHSPVNQRRAEHTNITASCSCQPGTEYTEQRDHSCPLHAELPMVRPFVDDDGNPI